MKFPVFKATVCSLYLLGASSSWANPSAAGAAAAPATTSPKTYQLEPKSSTLKWEGSKVIGGSKHHGTIGLKSGSIEVTGDKPTSAKIVVDMKSIVNEDLTDKGMNAKLVGHLSSADFFDVEKFPEATLMIKSFTPKGTDSYEFSGDLTIKDVTKPITMTGSVMSKDAATKRVKVDVTIDRTVWNVRYGSGKFFQNLGDKMISDEIKLSADLTVK